MKGQNLSMLEESFAFKHMDYNFNVIPGLTESVIVSKDIQNKIREGKMVDSVEVNRNSVSVYRNKLDPVGRITTPFSLFL